MFRLFRSTMTQDLAPDPPSLEAGRRVYAIGDIHGRLDLLREMIERIGDDDWDRGPVDNTEVILLGDLIDRGPDSAGVIDFVLRLTEWWPDLHCLKGNHEEVFLASAAGDLRALKFFLNIGGRETLASYGATPLMFETYPLEDLHEWLVETVPAQHLEYLETRPDQIVAGGYAFIHAGMRPKVPLVDQRGEDLRWIRAEFLDWKAPHDHFVIHGHSISDDVDIRDNRIGIDTGAFASGRLTAIGLEGGERWFLQTGG